MEKKMQYKIAWKVDKYRTDKRTGALSPVPRSKYAQQLFEEGAGWHDKDRKLGGQAHSRV